MAFISSEGLGARIIARGWAECQGGSGEVSRQWSEVDGMDMDGLTTYHASPALTGPGAGAMMPGRLDPTGVGLAAMSSAITIRAFTQSDVPFGMELKRLAGWNQLEADWRRFLALQPDGCFVAEAGSVPAGTATTTQYGLRLGWVGMVLVLPQMRRRGVGTALLRHCIDDLEARGVACVKLDATPLGKKLYDTLGFVDEYLLARWQAAATPPVGPRSDEVQPLGPDDVAELSEYDGPVFGADRREHLALLIDQGPGGCFLHRNERGHIDGYLCSRPGANAAQIGPWVDLVTKALPDGLDSPAEVVSAGFYVHKDVWVDEFTATPEPVTLSILVIGCGLALLRRRRA